MRASLIKLTSNTCPLFIMLKIERYKTTSIIRLDQILSSEQNQALVNGKKHQLSHNSYQHDCVWPLSQTHRLNVDSNVWQRYHFYFSCSIPASVLYRCIPHAPRPPPSPQLCTLFRKLPRPRPRPARKQRRLHLCTVTGDL